LGVERAHAGRAGHRQGWLVSRWRTAEDRPLFVYGSLQFPSVHGMVLGRAPSFEDHELRGWAAVRLEGRAFPALLPSPTHTTGGRLFVDLTPHDRAVLDSFEGPFYDLAIVRLSDGTEAATYVANEQAPLLLEDGATTAWSAEVFRRDGLRDYEARLRVWLSRADDSA